jgi:hypothetical protein
MLQIHSTDRAENLHFEQDYMPGFAQEALPARVWPIICGQYLRSESQRTMMMETS